VVVDVAVEVIAGDVDEWGALTVIARGVLKGFVNALKDKASF
jgi:hypothetical protein